MEGWGVFPATMRLHDDLDILIERHQKAQKPLNGKLPELPAQHLGDIGLPDAEKLGRFGLFQAALFHERVNLEDELRFDEVLFRIRQAEILEHIPAPGLAPFLAHCSLAAGSDPNRGYGRRLLPNSLRSPNQGRR
jgi:hypothetical protein